MVHGDGDCAAAPPHNRGWPTTAAARARQRHLCARPKIQPPRLRADLVARSRIENALAEALAHQRLVLISAPAGFGKTAALTRQLAALPADTAVAWVSADADDDLGRFAACLVAALEPFDLPWRSSPEAMVAGLEGGHEARQTVATELVNALLATEVARGLIVVDDAHRIEDPAVFEFLHLVIERLPDHWGVVDLEPRRPADRAGALARSRRTCRVSPGAAAFHRGRGRSLAGVAAPGARACRPARAARPHRRLGGRAAAGAGQLARAVAGAPAAASRRHLFDYLASEVLEAMPARLHRFLLRCSVLPELSAQRCAAVSGEADAAALLEQVEQRGLFVSVLDEQHSVLRLHDLFRDFLEDRLRQHHAEELPTLLRRAAASEPDPSRCVGYLVQAAAWAEAEGVLCEIGPRLIAGGAVTQVLRMIEQLPADWRDASPRLAHLRGLCAWAHWDIVTMRASLERAAAGFEQAGDSAAAQRARVLAVIGLTAGGAVPQAVALLAQVRSAPMDEETETTAWQATSWHALAAGRTDAVAEPLARMVDGLERSDDPMLWLQCVPPTAMMGTAGCARADAALRRRRTGAHERRTADAAACARAASCMPG